MHRFYADERGLEGELAHLCAGDAQHALRVLRMGAGDACELFVAQHRYAAVLMQVDGQDVVVRVTEELPSTEAALRITLYQGLPKADKMELIVQKAVELGAAAIVPVAMCRCVVKLDAKDGRRKQERWQKIAHEACKQSGRCVDPQVSAPLAFSPFLHQLAQHEVAIVPWENAQNITLHHIHQRKPQARDIAVVIGPEGGMSEDEVAQMQQSGCLPVTLGPRILRTETAGLATIAGLMCLWHEWE